jgi:protein MpaA
MDEGVRSRAATRDRVACAAMGRRARVAVVALALAATGAATTGPPRERIVFGHSVRHRPLTATLIGDPAAPHRVLVVGCIHGSERAGEAVTHALRRVALPAGVALWLVDQANPDGCRAGTRQNAHGVDLNRNSPDKWRKLDHPGGTYWSGPKSLSEPESQAIVRLVRRARPTVSIWYHQHARLIDDSGGDRRILRRYARAVGLPVGRLGPYPGTVTGWQNHAHPHTTAFVVELPPGRLRRAAVQRHVAAVLAVARFGAS